MKIQSFLLGAFLTLTLSASSQAADNNRSAERDARRMQSHVDWSKIQSELKIKYPKESAEIETLAKSDLFAATEKLRALAVKAGYSVGSRNRGGMPGGNMGPGGRGGNNPRSAVEEKLKTTYPTEYAEIVKLRNETETKLQELAKKAGLTLPALPKSREEIMTELKNKYPEEYAEFEKLQQTDRRAAFQKLRELMQKAGLSQGFERGERSAAPSAADRSPRENPARQLREIRNRYPKEWEAIQQLRESDPVAAQEKLRELIRKYRQNTTEKK